MADSYLPFFTSKHTEIGEVSASVTSGSYTEYSVVLTEPFSAAPHIILTLAGSYSSVNNAMGTRALVHGAPTATGFKIRAYNGTSATREFRVQWVAIGD